MKKILIIAITIIIAFSVERIAYSRLATNSALRPMAQRVETTEEITPTVLQQEKSPSKQTTAEQGKGRSQLRLRISRRTGTRIPNMLERAKQYYNNGRMEDCLNLIISMLQVFIVDKQNEPNMRSIRQLVDAYLSIALPSEWPHVLLKQIREKLQGSRQGNMRRELRPLVRQMIISRKDTQSFEQQLEVEVQEELKILFHNNVAYDRFVISELLKQGKLIDEAFENIFFRPDLKHSIVETAHVSYMDEGGFKRVYNVALRVKSIEHLFRFLIKVVKEDVEKSDTGHVYDMSFAWRLYDIAKTARERDINLHLPMGGVYDCAEQDGKKRIIYTEGLFHQSLEDVSEDLQQRLAVAVYLRFWLVFDKQVYLADPKLPNVIIQRARANIFRISIIDIDNIDFGKTITPFQLVDAFLAFGFDAYNIVLGAIDVMPIEEAEDFIKQALATLRACGDKRAEEIKEWFALLKDEQRFSSPDKWIISAGGTVPLIVNGRKIIVAEKTTLLELMANFYAPIGDTAVIYNGQTIQVSDPVQKEIILDAMELESGDEIVFKDFNSVFDEESLKTNDFLTWSGFARAA